MKTLMATDGSNEATAALRAASQMLRRHNNRVDLLCVAPEYPIERKSERQKRLREEYAKRITRETDAILAQSQQVLKAEGIDSGPISRIGSPADEIIKLSGEYDVTVVGARSRNNRSRVGLGPVASRVVEHASGLVLLARELSGESSLRVLVGLDGSLASRHALKALIAYFSIDQAEITLMHVIELPWIGLGLEREWFDSRGDVFLRSDPETQLGNELKAEAEKVIERARADLEDRSYSVMTMIEEGNPATELLGEAETKDYDLIVLGTTGITDTKHTLLGSVSAKIASDAMCSVAVVKHTE